MEEKQLEECQNGKRGFYRLKEDSNINLFDYLMKNPELPFDEMDKVEEIDFLLDETGKVISYGFPHDEFEAILRRREQKLITLHPEKELAILKA
jgi:hypothetical protein